MTEGIPSRLVAELSFGASARYVTDKKRQVFMVETSARMPVQPTPDLPPPPTTARGRSEHLVGMDSAPLSFRPAIDTLSR